MNGWSDEEFMKNVVYNPWKRLMSFMKGLGEPPQYPKKPRTLKKVMNTSDVEKLWDSSMQNDKKCQTESIDLLVSCLDEMESQKEILRNKLQNLLWCGGLIDNKSLDQIASDLNEQHIIEKQISDIDKMITKNKEEIDMLLNPNVDAIVDTYSTLAKEIKVAERSRIRSVVNTNVGYVNERRRREKKIYVPEKTTQQTSQSFFFFWWWGN